MSKHLYHCTFSFCRVVQHQKQIGGRVEDFISTSSAVHLTDTRVKQLGMLNEVRIFELRIMFEIESLIVFTSVFRFQLVLSRCGK